MLLIDHMADHVCRRGWYNDAAESSRKTVNDRKPATHFRLFCVIDQEVRILAHHLSSGGTTWPLPLCESWCSKIPRPLRSLCALCSDRIQSPAINLLWSNAWRMGWTSLRRSLSTRSCSASTCSI